MSAEAWFYHLERASIAEALAPLLEKCTARGWRALVVAGERSTLADLSERLWTLDAGAFPAHGLEGEPFEDRQPVLLATGATSANGASVLFLLDGPAPPEAATIVRTCVVFDGRDQAALTWARALWKEWSREGRACSYWKQRPGGGWEKER